MSIDWDGEVLGPLMDVFGEGDPTDSTTWPIYTPQGGAPFALRGAVFDRETMIITPAGDGTEIVSRAPTLGVRDALFGTPPKQGDLVAVPSAGKSFRVREARPDGHGHTRLFLNATS